MRVAFQESALKFLSLLILQTIAPFNTQVEKCDAVMDDPLLDLVVERTISLERGHLIDFDERWLELVIDHNVKAQDLEAHAIFNVIWLARAVQMEYMRLRQAQCFDNDLIDLILHLFHRQSAVVFCNLFENKLIRSLATYIVCILIIVLNKTA